VRVNKGGERREEGGERGYIVKLNWMGDKEKS